MTRKVQAWLLHLQDRVGVDILHQLQDMLTSVCIQRDIGGGRVCHLLELPKHLTLERWVADDFLGIDPGLHRLTQHGAHSLQGRTTTTAMQQFVRYVRYVCRKETERDL